MLEMSVQWMLSQNAPTILGDSWKKYVPKGEPRKAWFTDFNCRFGQNKEGSSKYSKVLHVCITALHEVFYAVSDDMMSIAPEKWVFESAHDSGWREMSFVSQLYFDGCEAAEPDLAPKNCPIRVTQWGSTVGEVVTKLVDGEHYKKEIVSVKH